MNRRVVAVVLLLGVAGASFAAEWSGVFQFRPSSFELQTITRDGQKFQTIIPGMEATIGRQKLYVDYLQEIGKPVLPYWFFTLVIPQGMKVKSVNVIPEGEEKIPAREKPYPAQKPVPISQNQLPDFVPPDPEVYAGLKPWPYERYRLSPVGVKSGFRLVTVSLFPVRYDPVSGCYLISRRLRVEVSYEPDPSDEQISLSKRQLELFSKGVRALVINPEDVNRFAPREKITDFGTYDYVVITNSTLEPYFQPLVNWRTRKGYYGIVRTTSWINSNYSGRDLQEKIRNFIKDYYNNYGIMWVLLGGDTAVVPTRRARSYCAGYTGNIPCDLYYADLQWSWDANNDNIFGEYGIDTTDLYYDVYIGRASVNDTTRAKIFVNKVLKHEISPPTDYLKRILLVDAHLWDGYDEDQSNDSIANITPSGWSDVHIHDPNNTTMVRDSLNNGFQFSHMVGHGNEYGIYHNSNPYYSNGVIQGHNNGDKVVLINSIACYSGNFEGTSGVPNCLAESTHNCSTGGALAVIMNSRYGWGTPPYIGPSELLDIRFYDFFFKHDTMPIGWTHAESKEVYRNQAHNSDGAWRWCYFELNLFGDPLQLMYEDTPSSLNASFPDSINTGSQNFTVTVTSGGSPVFRALVCLWKGSEVYVRNYTNSSGQVTFSINPTTSGYMQVTATKPNYLPDIDSCKVIYTVKADVGVTRIIAPTDTVDYGSSIYPAAKVKNYHSLPASNIPVRCKIGSGYLCDTIIPYLAGGDSITAVFSLWNAQPQGNLVVKCSTALSNDSNPSNDYAVGSVFVRYRDVGCVSIISPVGNIDSTGTVPVKAKVKNYGNISANFQVRFHITGPASYADTATVTLNAGDSVVVNFDPWVCGPPGSYSSACSTMLNGDMNAGNNKKTGSFNVVTHDISAEEILSPPAQCDSGSSVPVRVAVANYGSVTENVKISVRIPSFYYDSVTVPIPAHTVDTISLASWQVNAPAGSYPVRCSTFVANDDDRSNDTISTTTTVVVHDIAAIAIIAPTGNIDSGTVLAPQARLKNLGSITENFVARFTIGDGYLAEISVTLAPGADSIISFPDWSANNPGTFATKCTTLLSQDKNPANNRTSGTVNVIGTDAGAVAIIAPVGEIDPGPVHPVARVVNNSPTPQSFYTFLKIKSSDGTIAFSDSVMVNNLAPDSTEDVVFGEWSALPGNYTVRCSTGLGDKTPFNDTVSAFCHVILRDVGMVSVFPNGDIPEMTLSPFLRIKNFGTVTVNCAAYLSIVDSLSGSVVYFDSALVNNLAPGEIKGLLLSPWSASLGLYRLCAYVYLNNDIYPGNDTILTTLNVQAESAGWHRRPDLPLGTRRVKAGGALTAMATDSARIYALRGNKTFDFYAYNIQTKTWRELAPVPPGSSGRPVGKSGALCSDGERYIYATKGNNTLEFWRYDIETNSWEELPPIPAGAKVLRGGTGLAFVRHGDTAEVYCLKGSNTLEFYAYSVSGGTWSARTEPPAGISGIKFKTGSALCSYGSDRLYAIKALKNEFYQYSVPEDRWTTLTSLPQYSFSGRRSRCGDGCAMVSDQNNTIYALTGRNREFFYGYSIADNTWTELAPFPIGTYQKKVKSGGALTYIANQVWALRGNNTNDFYTYIPAPMPLSSSPPRSGVTANTEYGLLNAEYAIKPELKANRLFVTFNGAHHSRLTIFSTAGQVMKTTTLVPGTIHTIDISSLPNGVYLVQVREKERTQTQKLVILR
ncbi:MAG: C25 family cysteine peptidase [candidate division WOR-3 bacterium]